ncbi:hypothetical protein ACJJTC_010169 [Scirpophaga incertulas]
MPRGRGRKAFIPPPPPGLRGRERSLYYRNQARALRNQSQPTDLNQSWPQPQSQPHNEDLDNTWSTTTVKDRRPPPPPGLKGREIGLYYKSIKRETKKSQIHKINLRIPKGVITKLISDLNLISKIAEKENIVIITKNDSIFFESNIDKPKEKESSNDYEMSEHPLNQNSTENANIDILNESGSMLFQSDIDQPSEVSSDEMSPSSLMQNIASENINKFTIKNSNLLQTYIKQGKEKEASGDNEMSESSLNKQVNIEKSPKLVYTSVVKPIKTDINIDDPKPGPSSCDDLIPMKKNRDNYHGGSHSKSSPFTCDNFIPIKSDPDDYEGPSDRLLSLRGPSEYKYSYNDINTGSFIEKLDECLERGITITNCNDEIAKLNTVLYEEYNETLQKEQYKRMMIFRETLPTYKKRVELLNLIKNNQVVLISGETGCGKSTQVPQLILDDALMTKQGANVKIIITQPRRIAASSLAERVASERAQKMGKSVGYAVRLEKVEARARGSMMFCTTGVLLVDLEIDQGLTEYSHVILDEVHERDSNIDFAMCMLKQILEKHIYLEEILEMTNFRLPPENQENPFPNFKPHMKYSRKFRFISERIEKRAKYLSEVDPWLRSIKNKVSPAVFCTLQNSKIEDFNVDLIFELVRYICHGPPGAILIFLPGISEITTLVRIINQNRPYLGSEVAVYPLHSKLPTIDQKKIFDRPPLHIRKIIVATNIAETSITIDDIVYVIDSVKVKYKGLNVEQYLSTLRVEWAAQANLRQRRGRAGRCQPGICYHLVTTFRASKLEVRLRPELQRSDLLDPVLMIKRLRLGKAADALKNVPDPPADMTVNRAIIHLKQCGALDDEEHLTPLGWHLARLPLHPAAGKLVVFGALFGCLDRAASVAAVWSFKDPFIIAIEREEEVKAVKRKLARGEPSDQIAMSEAILQWERCAPHRRHDFSYANFLSSSTIELLSDMKKQIGNNLAQMGFLSSGSLTSTWENRNSENLSLFKAIIAASLYPKIGTAKWINVNTSKLNRQVRVNVRTLEGPVAIHPSSLMTLPKIMNKQKRRAVPIVKLCNNPGANWCVYWLKQKSTDIFVIDVTFVYTLPLLFFGELKVSECEDDPNQCYVSILEYKVQLLKKTAELLLRLRSLLDQVLASKIMSSSSHSIKHSQFEENVLNAVIEVLTAEDERAEYLDDVSESDNSEFDAQS